MVVESILLPIFEDEYFTLSPWCRSRREVTHITDSQQWGVKNKLKVWTWLFTASIVGLLGIVILVAIRIWGHK